MQERRLKAHERIVLPVDVSSVARAQELVDTMQPHVGVFKFGFEFLLSTVVDFIRCREQELRKFVRQVRLLCMSVKPEKVFMDVKLADIGNTVGKASAALSRLELKMFNIHASAGAKAIKEAVANKGAAKLFGVTVLTSIEPDECRSIFGDEPSKKVIQFAETLKDYGANGIICSSAEGLLLRQDPRFDSMTIAAPNIRPLWCMTPEERERVKDDQSIKRQLTPTDAAKSRIDMQIIGRPITNPPPEIGGSVKAAQLVAQEIASVTGEEV